MAYVVSTTKTTPATTGANYTITLGTHITGDLLLCFANNDLGSTALSTATAGWALIGTTADSSSSRSAWFWKVAASGAETEPTIAGTSAGWAGTCLVIRDAHASPFGSIVDGTDYKRKDWDAVNSTTSAAVTTAVDGCLLIYSWNADGNGTYLRAKINDLTALDKYSGSAVNHIIGYKQQQTAGAAPTTTCYSSVNSQGGNNWVLAVRNKASGALQPDIRPAITEVKWYGDWAAQHDGLTWQAPSNFAATINSITVSTGAPTISNLAYSVVVTWGAGTSIECTDAGPAWVGATHAISSTDFSGKVVGFQWERNAASTTAAQGAEGVLIGFSDGTNWAVYQVAKPAKGWINGNPEQSFVAPGFTTAYATSGSINWAAVTRVGYFWHKIAASTTQMYVKNLTLYGNTAITGGGSSHPATFMDYQTALTSWGHYNAAKIQGASQVLAMSSMQIGDAGSNTTYFDGAAQALAYPQDWSSVVVPNWQMFWNVTAGAVTLGVRAGASDTVKLAAGVASSDNDQLLTIASDSSASAATDFAQSFAGFTAAWDSDIPAIGATFTGGGQIAGKGADFTNCIFKNSTAGTTAAVLGFDANGAVLDGCTTVATTATGYHIELDTAVTAFTLTDHTFSGSALTDKVHVLKTTGTVTITISGTTSLAAGDVTSAGATVVISAPELYQVVIVSGFTAGSRIQIYDTTSSTELFNGTASAGNTVVSGSTATWTDPLAASANRAIRVRVAYVSGATAKLWQENTGLTCGQTSGTESITYPITQVADTTYDDNAVSMDATIFAACGITFTDAATDLVNINIAADTVALKTIYAAFVWWLFTAAGIDDDVAYIDAPNPANYIMTSMKFRNTSTDPLKITDGYFYDSTGSVENCVDITSPGNIYPMPEHVVPYQTTGTYAITGSLQDALDAIADVPADVLAAAAATPIHSDIRKVNSYTVDGNGQTGTEWGPA